jgi:hypothetical protein
MRAGDTAGDVAARPHRPRRRAPGLRPARRSPGYPASAARPGEGIAFQHTGPVRNPAQHPACPTQGPHRGRRAPRNPPRSASPCRMGSPLGRRRRCAPCGQPSTPRPRWSGTCCGAWTRVTLGRFSRLSLSIIYQPSRSTIGADSASCAPHGRASETGSPSWPSSPTASRTRRTRGAARRLAGRHRAPTPRVTCRAQPRRCRGRWPA